MITVEDIKLIITSGEGYNAEFKVSVPAKVKELSEEVCAFANAAGGVLLIGVNDNNEIKGVSIDNAKRSAIQNSLSEITPALHCSLTMMEVEGKTIGLIEVASGPKKPYVLSGAIYVRLGPNTQKLTTAEQMRDFFQQAEKIYFDEVPCIAFNPPTDIDAEVLAHFKSEANLSAAVPNEQIFTNLNLYAGQQQFKNGAVLFLGLKPEQFIEKAIIRCVAFQGIDKRFIIDDQVFGGSLYNQYTKTMQWLRGKLNVAYDIEGQGAGPRKEIWEIPETVFKETIINSLSHRDYYDKGAVITIELFEDRVEISNPGGLVSAISDAEFGKRSHSRNPLIFGLFARMHLVEQIGSGVGRILDLMKEAALPKPIFQKQGMFTVTLSRPLKSTEKSAEKSTEKSTEKILQLINENNSITTKELAKKIGISTSAIEKQIKKLKDKKEVERIGADKGGYWKVLKHKTN